MPRSASSVDRIMGRLFEDGLRRERAGGSGGPLRRAGPAGGAARRPSLSRLRHTGARGGKAIFKLIRTGGTHTRAGLKGQLGYVFRDDKLARVIDPTGRIEPHAEPEMADINRLTLDWSTDWWRNTRNGNTSHMILRYPKGTTIAQVETITRGVCEEMFEGEDRRFKY
ncbi:type IV secretion system T-DNA border endonuclease VirD2, partial [Jannaschia aquimarina]